MSSTRFCGFAVAWLCLVFFATAASAEILYIVEAPQDDMVLRSSLSERPEYKALRAECERLIQERIWPLGLADAARVFGLVLATEPADRVLPAFEEEGATTGGVFAGEGKPQQHVDTHAIADLGYVRIFYNPDGITVGSAVFFLKADEQFVPLRTAADLPGRLAWDRLHFAALKRWVEEHTPAPKPHA